METVIVKLSKTSDRTQTVGVRAEINSGHAQITKNQFLAAKRKLKASMGDSLMLADKRVARLDIFTADGQGYGSII